ncbi:MAG: DUF86 domain-containing protein [Parcubacteria group bacterium]|jgi:uncharacterized protein with HEPN domain
MKDNKFYIGHIAEAISSIEEYLNNVDFLSFSQNKMLFDAVVRELEIIGEASNNIGDSFQNEYPDIPWRKVIGMRNKITHEYFAVNKKVVWDTCKDDLPELKTIISSILAQ